jgi:hypothetical protein
MLSCGNAAAFAAMRLRFLDADTTGSNNALLRGSVSNFASPQPLAVGFVWSTTNPAPTLGAADGATAAQYVLSTSGFVTTTFSARTGALGPGTYFVRVYARGCGGAKCTYSPPGAAFAVPVFAEVAMVSATADPPDTVFVGRYDQDPAYGTVGFLWAPTLADLTLARCTGSTSTTPTGPDFTTTVDTSTLTPATYYVTAYALRETPGQPDVVSYGPEALQFIPQAPPVGEVAMVSVTQTSPPLVTFTADFQGSTFVFEELGFLWSTTVDGLYSGAYAGTAGGIASVVGNFAFALDTSVTPPPGTYYVTAYARSTLMSTTLLAENYMEFTVGA